MNPRKAKLRDSQNRAFWVGGVGTSGEPLWTSTEADAQVWHFPQVEELREQFRPLWECELVEVIR